MTLNFWTVVNLTLKPVSFRISYCTADKMHDKVFAYIAQNQQNETLECHAFLCAKRKVVSICCVVWVFLWNWSIIWSELRRNNIGDEKGNIFDCILCLSYKITLKEKNLCPECGTPSSLCFMFLSQQAQCEFGVFSLVSFRLINHWRSFAALFQYV